MHRARFEQGALENRRLAAAALLVHSVASAFSCSFEFGVNRGEEMVMVSAWVMEGCVMGLVWVEKGWSSKVLVRWER